MLSVFAALIFCLSVGKASAEITFLELLGVRELESLLTEPIKDPLGGLSGWDYDPDSQSFWAVTDDSKYHGGPKVFQFRLADFEGSFEQARFFPEKIVSLKNQQSELDLEAIRILPNGNFLLTTEGSVRKGIPPALFEIDHTGHLVKSLSIPDEFGLAPESGIRHNNGFESLAFDSRDSTLWTANESPLLQDGEEATAHQGASVRLVKGDLDGFREQYHYRLDPVGLPTDDPELRSETGLVEMMKVGGELLVLERSYTENTGNFIRLFRANPKPENQISKGKDLRENAPPAVEKELLLTLPSFNPRVDNLEGMSLGPRLPDGRRTLWLISDDNFNESQRSEIWVFALGETPLSITDIQGREHRSPYENVYVQRVEGIVTALPERSWESGFWMQEPGPVPDDFTGPSRAIFVHLDPSPIKIGQRVRVGGLVSEEGDPKGPTSTTIKALDWRVLAENQPLPPARRIGSGGLAIPRHPDLRGPDHWSPSTDAKDFFESLEGMIVEVDSPAVVGSQTQHKTFYILTDSKADDLIRTQSGAVLLQDPWPRTEILTVSTRQANNLPLFRVGDSFDGPIQGVLNYGWRNYKIIPTKSFPTLVPAKPRTPPQPLSGSKAPHRMTIATYNALNLSAMSKPAHARETNNATAKPSSKEEFSRHQRMAEVIVHQLGSPDIIALQEIQDLDGSADTGEVDGDPTLQKVVKAIREAGGPDYAFRQINPENNADGGQPGANIRNAFLLNPERIDIIDRGRPSSRKDTKVRGRGERTRLSRSPGRIGTKNPAFAGTEENGYHGSRKPLVLEVEFQGEKLFLVGVHLKSKGSDDWNYGPVTPPQFHSEPQRIEQVKEILSFTQKIRNSSPKAKVIILGDFNDGHQSQPLKLFYEQGWKDLILDVPEADRYTYNHLGSSFTLDHILLSPGLINSDNQVVIPHIHADYPDAERASDHDPVLAQLVVRSEQN